MSRPRKLRNDEPVKSMKAALVRLRPPCRWNARGKVLVVPCHCVEILGELRRKKAVEYLLKKGISIQVEL